MMNTYIVTEETTTEKTVKVRASSKAAAIRKAERRIEKGEEDTFCEFSPVVTAEKAAD
jgi:hypothetical protein